MKFGLALGILCAVVLHVAVLLFGGIFFMHDDKGPATHTVVELMSDDDAATDEKKPDEQTADRALDEDELKADAEEAPDSAEMIRNMEVSAAASMPELEAASLSAIEAALSGQSAGGNAGFGADSLDFASGGRIGGTGKAGVVGEAVESAFSLTEIDQQPRVVYQAAATFPSSMRGKKIEGVVSVLFVVDSNGKVENPRIDKSNGVAFEKPALDAVKNWKFEPAIKAGQRVPCKMRVSVRFPPS